MTKIANVGQTVEPVDSMHPHPRNPNQGDVGSISESIEAHGFYGQVIAQQSSRTILAGEHRWRAAKAAGMGEIPVTWVDVDDDQALRIVLVDNRSAELAYRDPQGLVDLLQELAQTPLALAGTGYDGDALDELLADLGPPKVQGADVVSEPPEKPVTKPGDLWELGPHRLLCGDATNADDYDRVLDGERAQLCLTDPPYGVGIQYGPGFTDDETTVRAIVDAFVPLMRRHSDRALLTPGSTVLWQYPEPDWILAWVEPAGTGTGPWGFTCTNLVLAYGKDAYLARALGRRPDAYVGTGTARDNDIGGHPVSKPVAVWEWFMERGSVDKGDLVLDPFGGSGTTLIAAENLGRIARLIELDPGYCDVIAKRYQGVSGIVPTRDGKPHDFLAGGSK